MPLDEAQRLHLARAVYSVTGYRPPNGESDLSSVRNEIEHYVDQLLREHTERAWDEGYDVGWRFDRTATNPYRAALATPTTPEETQP